MQRVRTTEHAWGTQVELCAPERRNALDQQAVADLQEAFTADGSGAVLLCAEGPAFCAGGDLSVLGRAAAEGGLLDLLTTTARAFADLVEAIVACPRPVVAAIDGPAVGGGASLALAADVRLATPRARLVFPWKRYGLPPDGHAATLLAHAVGSERARALLDQAGEIGHGSELARLVFTRVVESAELDEVAVETVRLAKKDEERGTLLGAMRAAREDELAALALVAADKATSERLAVLYKIDR